MMAFWGGFGHLGICYGYGGWSDFWVGLYFWVVLSDEQMGKKLPFSLLNDEQWGLSTCQIFLIQMKVFKGRTLQEKG